MSNRNSHQPQNFNLTDHLNTVRQINGVNAPGAQFSGQTQNGGSLSTPKVQNSGIVPLNSTRVVPSNKSKLIDSKLSSLRHEQDSTAASNNNHRFPMSPDEAFKILSPYLWDIEKKEIFEFSSIYFFPIDERKK